jgi:hypothetical protein
MKKKKQFFLDYAQTIINGLNIFLRFFSSQNVVVQWLGIPSSPRRSSIQFFSHFLPWMDEKKKI